MRHNMKLNMKIVGILFSLILTSTAFAKGGKGFGINGGVGVPFLQQAGINYFMSDSLSLSFTYNSLDLTIDDASVKLSMPEVLLQWHPFSASFYIGLGVGQESLKAVATDSLTSQTSEAEITAMTAIAKLGWMWGIADGGFWFGIDAAFITPSGADIEITSTLPTTDQAYIDAEDAAEQFGKTAFSNITFFRLGYLF